MTLSTQSLIDLISLNLGNGAPMATSAQLSMIDAQNLLAKGGEDDLRFARKRAITGLHFLGLLVVDGTIQRLDLTLRNDFPNKFAL
jgi:hypothetical protein